MKRIQHTFKGGIEKKRCSTCHKHKTLDNYYKSSRECDGLKGECKVCLSKYAKTYRDNMPLAQRIKRRENHRRWIKEQRKKNPIKHKLSILTAFHKWINKPGNRELHYLRKRQAENKKKEF